jgi:hypothetical protein
VGGGAASGRVDVGRGGAGCWWGVGVGCGAVSARAGGRAGEQQPRTRPPLLPTAGGCRSDHSLPVTSVCCGRGEANAIVASASLDRSVKLWSLATGGAAGAPAPAHAHAPLPPPPNTTHMHPGRGGRHGACCHASLSRACLHPMRAAAHPCAAGAAIPTPPHPPHAGAHAAGALLRTVSLPAGATSLALDAGEQALYAGTASGVIYECSLLSQEAPLPAGSSRCVSLRACVPLACPPPNHLAPLPSGYAGDLLLLRVYLPANRWGPQPLGSLCSHLTASSLQSCPAAPQPCWRPAGWPGGPGGPRGHRDQPGGVGGRGEPGVRWGCGSETPGGGGALAVRIAQRRPQLPTRHAGPVSGARRCRHRWP